MKYLDILMKTIFLLILADATVGAQNPSMPVGKNLVGRLSTTWNYYSQTGASSSLNALSNYAMLNYRIFDANSGAVKYQFKIDYYEKNTFTGTKGITEGQRFQNRYIVKQLYAAYGDNFRQVKAGRIIPLMPVVDAYPINGVSAENIRLGNLFDLSAFGGTINDFYRNDPTGRGYNYGGSLIHLHNLWSAGLGFTAEKYESTSLTKAYLYGDYKPVTNLRLYHRTQYIVNESLIGYSQSSVYYRFNKSLNFRTTFDYRNRTTHFLTRTDTINASDKYFYSSTEKNVSLTTNYRAYYNPRIGMLDISSTLKKRFGNGDLIYADLRTGYRNYFWVRLNTGISASYTSNQWLRNIQTALWFNRDFLQNRLDATMTYNLNTYQWNIKTPARNHLLSIISADVSYRITRDFFGALTASEEIGNATDPHTSVFIRMNYYLR